MYQFIRMMALYRNSHRLPLLDTALINGLAAADSPPINAQNYRAAPPEEEINRRLAGLIDEHFYRSFTEWHGRCCYFICQNPCELLMPLNLPPVYTQLIKAFQTAYPSKLVRLFAVRWATIQRLFFITEQGRLYYCTTDNSLDFLRENLNLFFILLSHTAHKAQTPRSTFIQLPEGIRLSPGEPGLTGIPSIPGSSFRFTL